MTRSEAHVAAKRPSSTIGNEALLDRVIIKNRTGRIRSIDQRVTSMTGQASAPRGATLQTALRLEYLTVGWNTVEGLVAVTAAVGAGSIALLGFGVDSFVECASGLVLLWRLFAERKGPDGEAIERIDRRAHRLVGATLLLLAAYVAVDAGTALWLRERPRPSIVGVVLTSVSLAAMYWLARAKRRASAALSSKALEADAFQTTACFWLSLITLSGIGLNAAFGWWWADPAAALGMTWFIAKEGVEAWRSEDCECTGPA